MSIVCPIMLLQKRIAQKVSMGDWLCSGGSDGTGITMICGDLLSPAVPVHCDTLSTGIISTCRCIHCSVIDIYVI